MNAATLSEHYVTYHLPLPGFEVTLYKRCFSAPAHLPRFVAVYPDGVWEGRDTKYRVDPWTGQAILPRESGVLA